MARHEVYLHLGLLDVVPRRGLQRRKIMDFIYGLRDAPNTQGDFTDRDSSLRERQIKVIGDYAITFWLDAPVKVIMVVDIRLADP
jgi:hypothetical protein